MKVSGNGFLGSFILNLKYLRNQLLLALWTAGLLKERFAELEEDFISVFQNVEKYHKTSTATLAQNHGQFLLQE